MNKLSLIKPLLIGAGALSIGAGIALAQEVEAFTKPVGYQTHVMKNGFNVFGVNFVNAPLVAGALTGVNGTTLTDTNADFSGLDTALQHTIEFEDGSWAVIASIAGTNVTTESNISAQVAAGDRYIVRQVKTIGEIFGPENESGLEAGTDANSSDIIWVPDGSGGFRKLYYTIGDGFFLTPGWKDLTTADENQADAGILFTHGLIFERVAAEDLEVIVTGHVKTTPTDVVVDQEYTYLSRIYPTGSTLDNSSLVDGVTIGDSATTSDNVWMPDGSGGFTKNYYTTGDGFFLTEGWKDVATGDADAADTETTSGYIMQIVGDTYTVTVTPPDFYADL
ncbi:MAG TPA: hypothetical protein VMN36_12120 [Verrucomicrobiales bacterium]|nr:hypothetical protein [Verrucomicrobiales bacterium]